MGNLWKALVAIFVLLGIFVLVFRGCGDRSSTPDGQSPEKIHEASKPIFQRPRTRLGPKAEGEADALCKEFWGELLSMDMEQIQSFPPRTDKLSLGKGCSKPVTFLQPYHQAFLQACGAFEVLEPGDRDEQKWNQEFGPCLTSLYVYRSALTAWSYKDTPLEKIADPTVLADKMIMAFFGLNTEPGELAQTAERLQELEPDLIAAKKAALIAYALQAIGKKGSESELAWENFDRTKDKLGDTEDSDIEKLDFLKMAYTGAPLVDIDQKAALFSREHLDSGWGPYMQGYVANKRGNRADAIRFVQEARMRENRPEYDAASHALSSDKGSGEVKGAFQVNASANFQEVFSK